MHDLTWVDYVIVAILGLSVLAGLYRGLFREILSLCTLIAAFVVATLFANSLASQFTSSDTVQNMVTHATTSTGTDMTQPASYVAIGLSFGILFIVTVIVGAIISAIINLIFASTILGIGNRIFGSFFGLCRGYLINLVLIFLVQLTSFSSDPFWTDSKLIPLFQPAVQWIGDNVSPDLADLKAKVSKAVKNTSE